MTQVQPDFAVTLTNPDVPDGPNGTATLQIGSGGDQLDNRLQVALSRPTTARRP